MLDDALACVLGLIIVMAALALLACFLNGVSPNKEYTVTCGHQVYKHVTDVWVEGSSISFKNKDGKNYQFQGRKCEAIEE